MKGIRMSPSEGVHIFVDSASLGCALLRAVSEEDFLHVVHLHLQKMIQSTYGCMITSGLCVEDITGISLSHTTDSHVIPS